MMGEECLDCFVLAETTTPRNDGNRNESSFRKKHSVSHPLLSFFKANNKPDSVSGALYSPDDHFSCRAVADAIFAVLPKHAFRTRPCTPIRIWPFHPFGFPEGLTLPAHDVSPCRGYSLPCGIERLCSHLAPYSVRALPATIVAAYAATECPDFPLRKMNFSKRSSCSP